jgi:GTPase SAR1 family protein
MIELPKVIDKIERSISTLDKINNIILNYEIYQKSEKVEKTKNINYKKDKLSNYLWKIKNSILEVAFVGLEKAGKSTFVNAFLGRNILPTADKRATYITTQVRFAKSGKVEVYFYTEEEFLNNVFRKMLKDVCYPESDIQTLDTVSIEDFRKHFESLTEKNPMLYEKHKNKLERDIMEIIEGKNEIRLYLKGGLKEFAEEDIDKYKPFITDPHKSRAVKEVVIYSSKLKGLENVIIYDLPGFDSPTFIHSEFTMDKIKKADAVVFVRIAKKPSLTYPEVEMITKTSEEDGLPLKEKTFFFAGMADIFYERQKLEENKKDFLEELRKYDLLVSENRVFFGSALAHLQEIGVEKDKGAIKRIQELGISTGIEELREALINYNKTERIKVLERRINTLINEIDLFLNEMEKVLRDKLEKGDIAEFKASSVLEIRRKAVHFIENEVNCFHSEIKQAVLSTKRISENLKKRISEIDLMLSDEEIERIRKNVEATVVTAIELPDAFNRGIREQIRKRVIKEFTQLVEESIDSEITSFKEKIVDIFMEAFSPSKEKELEVRENISQFLEKNLNQFSYEVAGLRAIVDRFSGDVIELLTIPLSSQDRVNKFKSVEREIYSLMAFHDSFDPKIPAEKMPFISLLLLQEDIYDSSDIVEKLEKVLGNKLSKEEIKKAAKIIVDKKLSFSLVSKKIMKSLPYINTVQNIINILNTFEENEEIDIYEMRKNLKAPSTYDEVLKEIEKDMLNLKEIIRWVRN